MKLFLFVIALIFSADLFAQNTPQEKLDSFSAQFVTAIRSHEQQRVFMSTDKSIYSNGESLWFKAFLVNEISDKINNDSKFLFVDLVDKNDDVIQTLILDAANKQTDSRIVLPQSLPSGNYWLRAYTRQILKTDPDNMSVKPIYVVNRSDESNFKLQSKIANPSDSLVVTFYPEGGNLITGADCNVAVQAKDLNGNPVAVKGLVRDNYDAVMAGFTTDANGLSKFDFEPSGHRLYRAVINWNGKERDYPLPPFNFYSGQVSVTQGAPNYTVRVLLGDSIYTKDALSYLIAISKDNMVFASIGRGLYQVAVPKSKLPDGIVTFYLFDEGFKLLSERSVYVDDNSLHVQLSTDKKLYKPHEKVTMDLSITGGDQKPVASLVAISVIDSAFSDPSEQCPALPADYTAKTIDNIFLATNRCLSDKEKDLLMLMRENNYEGLSKQVDNTENVDDDSLLYIKGEVVNEKDEPESGKKVTLISNSIFSSDITNNEGRFRFPLDTYADSTRFVLKITNLKGRPDNGKIVLDTIVYPKVKTPASLKEIATVDSRKIRKYLDKYYPSNQQNENEKFNQISFKTQTTLPKDQKLENYIISKRVSLNSAILTSKDLSDRTSVGNALLGVGGLHLLNGYLVINGLTEMGAPNGGSEPMILVNGAEVNKLVGDMQENSPDIAYLNTLDPKNIDFIEVLKGGDGARYGLRGANGVILVTTRNVPADDKTSKQQDNLKTFYANGISKPALFPITTYLEDDTKPATFIDVPPTLFWSGNYFTDKTNNTITFYTSGVPGTYKITVSGITIHGDIIDKTISIQTK
ncbi:MAG: TonB-dependent receptor plug domain-containing protein [Bacteroidota bacterium]|nr:TonB-dependent receptor plug domain-containing protein [Bacteroidota bacterium]